VIAVPSVPGLELRAWRRGDEDALCRHANSRAIWRNMTDLFPHPYTRDEADRWIGMLAERGIGHHFAIAIDDEPVGGCGAIPLAGMERYTANVGYWLGEAAWGRGLATAALAAMTAWLFEETRFERLQAFVYEWNPASMRVLEKNGYVREGWLRRSIVKDGHLIDRAVYARVRSRPLPSTDFA
jgi:RimJ/RimL family protein N-acetyltransferase